MQDNSSRPKMTDVPILVEPSFPVFTPRPIKENLNKQTANFIFVNTSPNKLIVKIVPNSKEITYSIRPEIDYLPPNSSRFVGISMSAVPLPKREHDFTYKVLALNPTEGFGISAVQFWIQNQLDSNGHLLQEAQFVCLEQETELQFDSLYQGAADKNVGGSTETSLSTEYFKRFRRYTALLDHSTIPNDSQLNSKTYYKKQKPLKDIVAENVADPEIHCSCQCRKSNPYFWQEAATMRSFFYGFALAFLCSAALAIRKIQING